MRLAHFKLKGMPEAPVAREGACVYLPLSVAMLFAAGAGLGGVHAVVPGAAADLSRQADT